MKDEFLATVSHELRTPLNTIMGWAHILRTTRVGGATATRGIEAIARNAEAQAQLIEDILDTSRAITGTLHLKVGAVDLALVIDAALEAVRLAAEAQGIRLEVNLDPSSCRVTGDASRLQQVVWNLLSNAIKFTPRGGRAEVRLARVGTDAQITVSDTGQGIAPEFLPFIFERFRQADPTTTRQHCGLGLGLSIVRHLVELHGGTIQAESAGEGRGAVFTIRLPRAAGRDRRRGRRIRRAAGAAAETSAARPTAPLQGVHVLLVDDDRDALDMLVLMLRDAGATVHGATSVEGALELARRHAPDVLVSDLSMPGQDGYSLIRRLRARDAVRGQQTPAIAVTAYLKAGDRARAMSAGFNMFVHKPVDPAELIAGIASRAGLGRIPIS